jgi:5,10-methylenetetrahydromethanopterin reductase
VSVRFSIGVPARSIARFTTADRQDLARRVEALGFEALWHSNERFYQDLWIGMTLSAAATSRIALGTAVVEPYGVHPVLSAVSLATFDHVCGGRALLGVAPGGSGFPALRLDRPRPAAALREAIHVIRRLLAGETVDLDGDVIKVRGARLHFQPLRARVPVMIATRGDALLRLAGEIAEGIIVATYATPDGVRHALGEVTRGAARAGRRLADLDVMARVDTCILPDRARARDQIRMVVALMLWTSYPTWTFVKRLGLRVPDRLAELIARRDYDLMHEVGALVPDELVDAYTWAGTADDVAAQVARLLPTGVRHFGFWIRAEEPHDVMPMLDAIGGDVRPRVEAAAAALDAGGVLDAPGALDAPGHPSTEVR